MAQKSIEHRIAEKIRKLCWVDNVMSREIILSKPKKGFADRETGYTEASYYSKSTGDNEE